MRGYLRKSKFLEENPEAKLLSLGSFPSYFEVMLFVITILLLGSHTHTIIIPF